ncbi:MAG: nucleoside hydrolase [Oscillospiraceae bacterium]|nr:nucleoside hydrolase [Oscillospiraceae bacterium]
MNKIPLIIDTDFTKDDIIAIKLLADSDKYDIKAITCYGEWFVETVQLRNSMGLDCPVCWGAMKPLFRPEVSENIYGNTTPDTAEKVRIEEKDEQYPWDTIYNTALESGGELEIITLGPVTNIALTLLRYPQIKPMIKRIFCFAGSGYSGNVAPYSEYNAYADPDALKIVFDSGVDVVMCGLDAVDECVLSTEEADEIRAENPQVESFLEYILCEREKKVSAPSVAAVCCYMNHNLVPIKDFYVAVETKSRLTMGQTVVDRLGKYKKAPNIKVVVASNKTLFVNSLKNITI